MTVQELIAKLQELEPGTPVAMHEEPHGLDLVRSIRRVDVRGDRGWQGDEVVVVIDTMPLDFYKRD
jgi:hypothetical protein